MTQQAPGQWLLAIDTSTEQAGLALTNGDQILEVTWRAGRDQTVTVLPQIDHLLELAGIAASDLAAIAIATGPGMFNGLRVGISIAKGFHLGLGIGLIGVSTFDVTAYPHRAIGLPVVAVIAAGRGRLVWTVDGLPEQAVNSSVTELADQLRGRFDRVLVAGELTPEQAGLLSSVPGLVLPPLAARLRRPGVLAAIGWSRLRDGELDDPITLAPVYVHGAATPARG
jgi:tRNA threonylcarbamoyladenosine biosynthesis protein TsaB